MCISENILDILGKILCVLEIILYNFRGKFSVFDEIFCALFLEKFCAFQKRFDVKSGNILYISKNIWCNSGNIWYIMKETFCVFKKTFSRFFEERFFVFFKERFCALQKRFDIFPETFCVFRWTYFVFFRHRSF